MSRTITSVLAALIITSAVAPAALAEAPPAQSSVRVAYGDLDISGAADGKMLLRRIETAARKACDNVSIRSPAMPRVIASCSRETVAETVQGLNIETLTLAWSGKYPATRLASR